MRENWAAHSSFKSDPLIAVNKIFPTYSDYILVYSYFLPLPVPTLVPTLLNQPSPNGKRNERQGREMDWNWNSEGE
jgi:hypothetical protein